ncbi:hypothetical protein ACP6PL_23630 [Dapis sp. BLCC M126]|uniref:hypothetical protein n=1 Tax=Dapis sp. BLCC M126 TaxID=3400189 RepID=UPI003CE7CA61
MIELLSLTSLAIRKGRLNLPITSYLIRGFKISDRSSAKKVSDRLVPNTISQN